MTDMGAGPSQGGRDVVHDLARRQERIEATMAQMADTLRAMARGRDQNVPRTTVIPPPVAEVARGVHVPEGSLHSSNRRSEARSQRARENGDAARPSDVRVRISQDGGFSLLSLSLCTQKMQQ